MATMALGAASWLAGNLLWLSGAGLLSAHLLDNCQLSCTIPACHLLDNCQLSCTIPACHLLDNCQLCCVIPACSSDRKSTRLNSSHHSISYAVFCLKKKKNNKTDTKKDVL